MMQNDGNAKDRIVKPHPFWDSECRERLASKPKKRTRAGVKGTRTGTHRGRQERDKPREP
jgi:hypothetical protein